MPYTECIWRRVRGLADARHETSLAMRITIGTEDDVLQHDVWMSSRSVSCPRATPWPVRTNSLLRNSARDNPPTARPAKRYEEIVNDAFLRTGEVDRAYECRDGPVRGIVFTVGLARSQLSLIICAELQLRVYGGPVALVCCRCQNDEGSGRQVKNWTRAVS
jgi:hypothetical protein